ncbi:MAG TPA: M28 family peptidase, partial [Gemmatimonadales bacterium]|nr:M28 family peptidase [Gemmatimonadales bacterium]
MLGREAGAIGNMKATDYIAAELRRMGVEPAGENGTYFQTLPLGRRTLDTTAVMSVGTQVLVLGRDYLPLPNFGDFLPFGMRGSLDSATAIYGGRLGEAAGSLRPEQYRRKLVVLLAPAGPVNAQDALGQAARDYREAAGVAFALLDFIPPEQQRFLREPQEGMGIELPEGPLGLLISQRTAAMLLGAAPDTVRVGHAGVAMDGSFRYVSRPLAYPARNVIGVVRGGDPVLRHQYVALGAHNDHEGTGEAVDHDSLWAHNRVVRPEGAESPMREPTAEERTRIRALIDSLRASRPRRTDSIYNGADDDGSGTVAVLEVAEALAAGPEKPRRSILFVWHTAEEKGLYGSAYFTDHPTVPRDSIVAQLNLDMVGRGQLHDIAGGGSGYMQIIGSRRLSTELGDLIETVNTRGRYGFRFDYAFDAVGHPQNYYCRSDHYMYARYGIP